MRFDRIVMIVAVAASMSGCHSLLAKFEPNCHKPQEYVRAREVAPLTVPDGLDKPNTAGALAIPTVDLAPPPPGPKDQCLEVPPRYQAAPTNKAGSSSG